VEVRAERPGAVVELLADEGDEIRRGQPLAIVRAEQERAALDTAQAEVRALEAELALAAGEYERSAALSRNGWVTRARLDRDRAALATARARLAAARARATAQAAVFGETILKSPLDGVVLARPIDRGQVIGADDVVFSVGTANDLEIEAEADEIYADAVRVGQEVVISPAGSTRRLSARVSEVSPRVDPRSGGRLVRVVPDSISGLRPGRSVDVNIVTGRLAGAISVPRSSVIGRGARQRVLVLEEGRVTERTVQVLDWPGERAVVRAGVESGDLVVLNPLAHSAGSKGAPRLGDEGSEG